MQNSGKPSSVFAAAPHLPRAGKMTPDSNKSAIFPNQIPAPAIMPAFFSWRPQQRGC
jgi:hypothetical protein